MIGICPHKCDGSDLMNVDAVNTYAAKHAIFGWLAGLAYYNWFASQPPHLPLWVHAILVFGGMFAASIAIGGGMALLAAAATRITTGHDDGSIHAFSWAAFISPVLAFFASGFVFKLLS